MTKNLVDEPMWYSHMCVEADEGNHQYDFKINKDLSEFENLEFANSCIQFL